MKVEAISRDLGISIGTFYNWRSKYAGLGVNEAKRLQALEIENNKLKRLLAERLLAVEAMKLDQVAESRSLPEKIVSDNGPEFTSKTMFF